MPRVRLMNNATDVELYGNVWDACGLLRGVCEADLRSFVDGPWGRGDHRLANRMLARCKAPPCSGQCFVSAHVSGKKILKGCTCAEKGGWKYTDDDDVQKLEGCQPNDVWSDARALEINHRKIGGGADDPIKCDCDDLASVAIACQIYEAWMLAGSPAKKSGRPIDPPDLDMWIVITKPDVGNMAHAWVLSSKPPFVDSHRDIVGSAIQIFDLRGGNSNAPLTREPIIKVKAEDPDGPVEGYVFDPAGRFGMTRPRDEFYGNGKVAVYPVRLRDL